eukprot:m.189367 g.189367  ORF g.189367 m.189367 type:complete len:216 (-) comp17710_c0_seq1:29-676(-)
MMASTECAGGHGSHKAASADAAAAAEPQGLKGAIEKIREIQERRNETFFLFERGFQELLRGQADFVGYRALCHEVTEVFSTLSADMQRVQHTVAALERTDLVELVGRIQALEKQRLALVAQSQIARQPSSEEPATAGAAPADDTQTVTLSDAQDAERAPPSEHAAPKTCADEADNEDAGVTDGGGVSGAIRREFLAVCQNLSECVDELKYEELDD